MGRAIDVPNPFTNPLRILFLINHERRAVFVGNGNIHRTGRHGIGMALGYGATWHFRKKTITTMSLKSLVFFFLFSQVKNGSGFSKVRVCGSYEAGVKLCVACLLYAS